MAIEENRTRRSTGAGPLPYSGWVATARVLMYQAGHVENAPIPLLAAIISVPLLQRLKVSPVLGHPGAGIIVGPHGAGLIGEVEDARLRAAFGVVFLLFAIGLDLSLQRLQAVWRDLVGLGLAAQAPEKWRRDKSGAGIWRGVTDGAEQGRSAVPVLDAARRPGLGANSAQLQRLAREEVDAVLRADLELLLEPRRVLRNQLVIGRRRIRVLGHA